MKRLNKYAMGVMGLMCGMGNAWAGEASTSANASNGWRTSGSAGATANYTGEGNGPALARTRTGSGKVNWAEGLAVGVDRDGLDFSFSHALANKFGAAYAGTFNLSIGYDGSVTGSYGGVVSRGGVARSAEAGGVTRTSPYGATSMANANGNTAGGGTVKARVDSFNTPRTPAVWRSR